MIDSFMNLLDQPHPGAMKAWSPPTELPDLSNVKSIELDTETTGKDCFGVKPVGISVAYETDELHSIYLPFGHSAGNLDEETVRWWAIDNLRDKHVTGANIKYDIHVLRGWGVDLEELGCTVEDVQFHGALLDDSPFVKVDLETLGQKYAGVGKLDFPYDKNKMKEYPSWVVGSYAERDTKVTHLVKKATRPLLEREDLIRVLELENSIIYAVCEIERNGCRIDVEKLNLWRIEVREVLKTVLLNLYNSLGFVVDVDSPDSIAKVLRTLNLKPPVFQAKGKRKKAGTGKRKYTEEELLGMSHPVMSKIVEARWMTSLLSKFLDKYHRGLEWSGTDVLRSQFHQLKTDSEDGESKDEEGSGTVSGRFSSSGGDLASGFSFNAQQVIKTKKQKDTLGDRWIIRELFIPDDGYDYFSGDLSQIEYRIAAAMSGSKKIIKAYNEDPTADFHALAGKLIQRYKPSFTDRTLIKNANFAFTFGSAEETLAATAGISISEAGEVLAIMRRDAPEIPAFLKRLAFDAEHKGFVTTLYGRRARFGTHEKRYYAALNRVVQGSAADIFKVTLRDMYNERKTLGIHKLRQIVHDESNLDIERGELYTKRMQEFLNTQRVDLGVPVIWETRQGNTWKDCH